MNIARTTLSSKILTQHKDFFAKLAVEAVERLKGSGNLEAIQVIKKLGGGLEDSYLEEGELTYSQSHIHTHFVIFRLPFFIYFRFPAGEEGGSQPAKETGECSYTHR